MSEKLYAILLRLYPSRFRDAYGEQAMQLFRDRAHNETGIAAACACGWTCSPTLPSRSRASTGTPAPASSRRGRNYRSFEFWRAAASSRSAGGWGRPLTSGGRTVLNRQPHGPAGSASKPIGVAGARSNHRRVVRGRTAGTEGHVTSYDSIRAGRERRETGSARLGRQRASLIFLAGMGNTAHIFDPFAPKFTANHHVYGITRRGFGASSQPPPTIANYAAARLRDDILTVIDALKIDRPVLAGHSIAGAELSSIATAFPAKIAGAVYLDAGYAYAFYDRVHGDGTLDMIDIRKRIDQLQDGTGDRKQVWMELRADLERLHPAVTEITDRMASMANLPTPPAVTRAIQFGEEKYTNLRVPILAIFAIPRDADAHTLNQVAAFEAGVPSARVVRLENASHYVFQSNEADVLREMNAFLEKLR